VRCIAAPQIAPDTTRDARGAAFNRLRVKGNLSAISSLIANSAILLEALAEIILANGECPDRIHPRLRNQAITAGAVIGRRPATAPMPIVNTGECCRFIFLSESQSDSVHFRASRVERSRSRALHPLLLNIVYGICRRLQSLHFHLESRWRTSAC